MVARSRGATAEEEEAGPEKPAPRSCFSISPKDGKGMGLWEQRFEHEHEHGAALAVAAPGTPLPDLGQNLRSWRQLPHSCPPWVFLI